MDPDRFLLSPILAVAITTALYRLAVVLRRRVGAGRELCVCVGREGVPIALAPPGVFAVTALPTVVVSTSERCRVTGCPSRPRT